MHGGGDVGEGQASLPSNAESLGWLRFCWPGLSCQAFQCRFTVAREMPSLYATFD